jgi:chromosome segregation ATPase
VATEGLLEAAQQTAADKRALYAARVRVSLCAEEVAEVRARVGALQRERAALAGEVANLQNEIALAKSLADQQASAEEAVLRAEASVIEVTDRRDRLREQKVAAEQVCEVLGLKGARCLLLERALRGLEAGANAFLGQVHPTLRLKLGWDGKESDKVSLDVTGGPRDSKEYVACSGGQRVLVDVALVVGMAALRGGDGLLVFDEVFDSLDAQRVEVVAQYVQKLAAERQVVVISHREDLAQLLRAARRWRAVKDEDGLSRLEDA